MWSLLRSIDLESEGADIAEIGMVPSPIIETIDILEDGGHCLTPCWPALSPKHFGLQALEKDLDHGVVVTVSLAGHGRCHLVFRQSLLKIMRAILADVIRMENTVKWWFA